MENKYKPKLGNYYWYYSRETKSIICYMWLNSDNDFMKWKLGNCYESQKEAIKGKELMDKIVNEFNKN